MGFLGEKEELSARYARRIKGYITARNEFDTNDKSGNLSRGIEDEDIMRWVRARCRQCPGDRIGAVVLYLTEEMWLRRQGGNCSHAL